MASDFPVTATSIVKSLAELFLHQRKDELAEILMLAKPFIEETEYDNWNNGTFLYTLFLEVPIRFYASIESNVKQIEQNILNKVKSILRDTTGNQVLNSVVIKPVLIKEGEGPIPVSGLEASKLWGPGVLRVFLCHVAAHKDFVSALKNQLLEYGIASFVAHEDIEPTTEWQAQIEIALRSMHCLVALLTPDFHQSNWTDQEMGIAIGYNRPIIPVRLGIDPYGFIGKIQGLPGLFDYPKELSASIVDVVLNREGLDMLIRESLVFGLENSTSWVASIKISDKIRRLDGFTMTQVDRMIATIENNSQVKGAFYVPEKIQEMAARYKLVKDEDIPF